MTLSSDSRLSFFLVLDYSGTHDRYVKKTGPTFYSDGIPKEEEEVAVRSKRPTRTTSAKKVQLSPAELDSLNKLPGLFLGIKYGTNHLQKAVYCLFHSGRYDHYSYAKNVFDCSVVSEYDAVDQGSQIEKNIIWKRCS